MWTEDGTGCNPYLHYVYTYTIEGDTIIDSLQYNKIICQNEAYFNSYIREDTAERKVYCINHSPDNCEYILYDFNLQLGDTFCNNYMDTLCGSICEPMTVNEATIEFFAGKNRKKIVFHNYPLTGGDMIWYEGIGSMVGGVFKPKIVYVGGVINLLCYFENSTLLYHNTSLSSDCFVYSEPVFYDNELFKVQINNQKLNISTNSQSEFRFELFDITGRKRISGKYKENTNIDLSELSKGIYIYNIRGDDSGYKVSGKVFVSE